MILSVMDTKILKLINQYSINGSITPISSGTLQDYLLRTRDLVDTCQKEIANIYPVIKQVTYPVTAATSPTDFTSNTLPADLETVLSVELNNYPDFNSVPFNVSAGALLTSPFLSGTLVLTYSKLPTDINSSSADSIELEIDKTYQELIPFYVAGHVFLEDNPSIGTMLINEYEQKLSRSKRKATLPQASIVNGWGW